MNAKNQTTSCISCSMTLHKSASMLNKSSRCLCRPEELRLGRHKKARLQLQSGFFRDSVGIRTPNLRIRSAMLYPVELQSRCLHDLAANRGAKIDRLSSRPNTPSKNSRKKEIRTGRIPRVAAWSPSCRCGSSRLFLDCSWKKHSVAGAAEPTTLARRCWSSGEVAHRPIHRPKSASIGSSCSAPPRGTAVRQSGSFSLLASVEALSVR